MRGAAVAISEVAATEGHLQVGDALHARMADTRRDAAVAAVYDRSAGLGDIVLDAAVARRTPAPGRRGGVRRRRPGRRRSLARYAEAHPASRR